MIGHRAVISFLSASLPLWPAEIPVTVLNICGSFELGSKLKVWAKLKKCDLRVIEATDVKEPRFLQAQQFDYVVSDGGLNGKSEADVHSILVASNRLARRGLAFTGPLRWAGGSLTLSDVRKAAESAGLKFTKVQPYWGCRYLLSGERGLVLSPILDPFTGFAGA